MQPDTTSLKMAKDIIVKLGGQITKQEPASKQPEHSESQQSESLQTDANSSISGDVSRNQIQVVPLYTPTGAAVKFFCVHPSHRYALSLVPISSGFQGQVNTQQNITNSTHSPSVDISITMNCLYAWLKFSPLTS